MTKAYAPARRANGNTTWCGPYALAAVMGTTYEAAEAAVKHLRLRSGRTKTVKGVYGDEMVSVMKKAGVLVDTVDYTTQRTMQRPTLTRWYAENAVRHATYVVFVTGHFVVMRNGKLLDNQKGKWVDFATAKHFRRARVKATWRVMVEAPAPAPAKPEVQVWNATTDARGVFSVEAVNFQAAAEAATYKAATMGEKLVSLTLQA